MSEEFSFDFNIDEKSMKKLRESLGLEKLEEIHNRFKNGTETEDDLINHYESYKIKCVLPDEPKKETELDVVETKYYKKIINLYQKEKEKNKKLEKQMGKDLDAVYLKAIYDERDKWKNKIRKKIKELYDIKDVESVEGSIEDIKLLKELLEENNAK